MGEAGRDEAGALETKPGGYGNTPAHPTVPLRNSESWFGTACLSLFRFRLPSEFATCSTSGFRLGSGSCIREARCLDGDIGQQLSRKASDQGCQLFNRSRQPQNRAGSAKRRTFSEKGRYEMTRRELIALGIRTTLLFTGAVATSGCGSDDGNPARGSISAPRTGGGKTTDIGPEPAGKGKGRGKAVPSRLGGKGGANN
jgi:hypothetical protein